MADGNDGNTRLIQAPAPPPPTDVVAASVVAPPVNVFEARAGSPFVFWMASIADTVMPWGQDVVRRDKQLRDFWPQEPFLAGAIYTVCISNAAFKWRVVGPKATAGAVQTMLHHAQLGEGWQSFITRLSLDLLTSDNGTFIEVIRAGDSPSAPVMGIQVLDSAQCVRTGVPDTPVIYTDRQGRMHKMRWYQVIALSEFPSTIESMYGVQYSAVTRVLRAAQVLRDYSLYKGEKIGGRFTEAIHVIGGVAQKHIDDIINRQKEQADNEGLVRYMMPVIVGSLDPQAEPRVVTLNLKSLPEGFDLDKELKWYIASLGLGLGRDYQDFAPLSSGNLGTAEQSTVLHMKARGKGPGHFMGTLEQAFNFYGVMPRTVTFEFEEQDIQEDKAEAEVSKSRWEAWKVGIDSGTLSPRVVASMAFEAGELNEEQFALVTADLDAAESQAEEAAANLPAADDTLEEGEPVDTDAGVTDVNLQEGEPEATPSKARRWLARKMPWVKSREPDDFDFLMGAARHAAEKMRRQAQERETMAYKAGQSDAAVRSLQVAAKALAESADQAPVILVQPAEVHIQAAAAAAPITFSPEIHVEQPATTLKAELTMPDVVEETTVVRERPDDPTSPIRKLIKRITRKESRQ